MSEHTDGMMEVELRWEDASTLPTLYANQAYITHAAGEFYLIFGEVQLPILLDTTREAPATRRVFAVKPVAKLALTPRTMKAILAAMSKNVGNFDRRQQELEEQGT